MMNKGWIGLVLACSFFLVTLSVGGGKALAYTGEGQKTLILKSGSEDPIIPDRSSAAHAR
jgi:hypothetical protein